MPAKCGATRFLSAPAPIRRVKRAAREGHSFRITSARIESRTPVGECRFTAKPATHRQLLRVSILPDRRTSISNLRVVRVVATAGAIPFKLIP